MKVMETWLEARRERIASCFFVVSIVAVMSFARAEEGPSVKLRVVDNQLQVGADSARAFHIQWRTPDGVWQSWNEQSVISADLPVLWFRGVFQPEDVTSWELPEDAGPLVVPACARTVQEEGYSWSSMAVQQADGSLKAAATPLFDEVLGRDEMPAGGSLPDSIAEHANLIWFNPTSRNVVEWILSLGGSMQSAFTVTNMSSGAYVPAGMGDVDGDGISDLFLYDAVQRKVAVWLLTTEGRYGSGIVVNGGTAMSAGWLLRAIGDIDQDGTADIVWHNSTSRKAAFWLLESSGALKSYGLCTNMAMSAGWSMDGSGDIDGDGTMDLLWYNPNYRRVAYWFLNADGSLRESGFCTTNTMAPAWQMRGVGDIKGDGTMAILWHNSTSKLVAYWFLKADGTLDSSGLAYGGQMSGGWELKATVDINGDRTMDAVWFNTTTRKTAYWLMAADGTMASSGYCTNVAVASGYTLYAAGTCEPGSGPGDVWTEAASLPLAVYEASGAVYSNSIYYCGGFGSFGFASNVYRYSGTTWQAVPSLPGTRGVGAACVYNGHLYYIGGLFEMGTSTTTVYRFNGTAWSEVASLPRKLSYFSAVSYSNYLYVIGGWDDSFVITNVLRFNGAAWQEVPGLPTQRAAAGATVYDGHIYLVGGTDGAFVFTNVYKFNGTAWTEVPGLPAGRAYNRASVMGSYIYAAGGYSGSEACTNVWRFNGADWEEISGLPQPTLSHAQAVYNDRLYVAGGTDYSGYYTNTWYYTP